MLSLSFPELSLGQTFSIDSNVNPSTINESGFPKYSFKESEVSSSSPPILISLANNVPLIFKFPLSASAYKTF